MNALTRMRPLAVVLMTTGLIGACSHESKPREAMPPITVRTTQVVSGPVVRMVEAGGSLHGVQEAVLAAKVMGSVVEIRKQAGDPIKQGDILVVLDGREVAGNIGQAEGGLAQAEAAAALAEANYKRYELLFERGSASQLELDQARFANESAKGAVQQARAAVQGAGSYRSYTQIPAPFDGRVVDRLAEVGDLAAPGRPLMSVEDASSLRLHVSLSENEAGVAQPGDSVVVEVPSVGGKTWTGVVAQVVPAVDPATRTLLVKIDLPKDGVLRSGMFARAHFEVGEREALSVPRTSLLKRGGMDGVFVVENNTAMFRLVQPAASPAGDAVEVLAGLTAGDRVVLNPPPTLTEGAAVEVQP